MHDISQTHTVHGFIPIYHPDFPRQHGDSQAELSQKFITDHVETVYAYEYIDRENRLLHLPKENVPRQLPQKVQRRVLSVVEKHHYIGTDYKSGNKPSNQELQSVDSSKAKVFVDIHSVMIFHALRDIMSYYPGYSLWD